MIDPVLSTLMTVLDGVDATYEYDHDREALDFCVDMVGFAATVDVLRGTLVFAAVVYSGFPPDTWPQIVVAINSMNRRLRQGFVVLGEWQDGSGVVSYRTSMFYETGQDAFRRMLALIINSVLASNQVGHALLSVINDGTDYTAAMARAEEEINRCAVRYVPLVTVN